MLPPETWAAGVTNEEVCCAPNAIDLLVTAECAMTIDVPRPAWATELGLRVAADVDLAAPEPRFSANDHGEIWSSARWAAVAADIQENVRMSEGDWSMVDPATVDLHLGWAEHLLDNLDEMAAETARGQSADRDPYNDYDADGS